MIKVTKGFRLIPEGVHELEITKVELVPSGKPKIVKFTYKDNENRTLMEQLDSKHDVGGRILGQRVDLLFGGTLKEGTDIELENLPDWFMGKRLLATIVHNESERDGKTRTFANIKFVNEFLDTMTEEDLDEDDDL